MGNNSSSSSNKTIIINEHNCVNTKIIAQNKKTSEMMNTSQMQSRKTEEKLQTFKSLQMTNAKHNNKVINSGTHSQYLRSRTKEKNLFGHKKHSMCTKTTQLEIQPQHPLKHWKVNLKSSKKVTSYMYHHVLLRGNGGAVPR